MKTYYGAYNSLIENLYIIIYIGILKNLRKVDEWQHKL